MEYKVYGSRVKEKRQSFSLTRQEVHEAFIRAIKEAGYDLPNGICLIIYQRDLKDDKKKFVFKVTDTTEKVHVWTFTKDEGLIALRKFLVDREGSMPAEGRVFIWGFDNRNGRIEQDEITYVVDPK